MTLPLVTPTMSLAPIREVRSLNPSRDTDCPDFCLSYFPPVLQLSLSGGF